MSRILLVYATGEGQTEKVATRLADRLRGAGHEVTVSHVSETDAAAVEAADGVLLAASIHMGKPQDAVVAFASEHRDLLAARPSGYVEVCLSAAVDDPERQADAHRYVDEFRERTGWDPDAVGVFGGAVRYSQYGFLKRRLMKRIAAEATGDTDTSRDYEYTDWDAVAAFAAEFGDLVVGDVEAAP
ncbi:flavodoxin domain-containing protein [Halorarius halobius]|uniref:flavodoxin domain-containing protein n=1 Tax=Halorarius halobius TaxID=2962671 RepID=UPI0020CEF6CE|nr:flavodoxin domain-containing protein [Halorarius halobius]